MMGWGINEITMLTMVLATLTIVVFFIDWRFFHEWVVVYLFKSNLDLMMDNIAVTKNLLVYPIRLIPQYFQVNLLFDVFFFPVLCILYNQITRESKPMRSFLYAVLFAVVMTIVETPIEMYTDLLEYLRWNYITTFVTLTGAFLFSRVFMGFFRWGVRYFGRSGI